MKINKIFFVLALSLMAITLYGVDVKAADTDLVQNGNFESGSSSWTNGSNNIINSTNFDGNYYAAVGVQGAYDDLFQTGVNIPSNATSIKMRFNYVFHYEGETSAVGIIDQADPTNNGFISFGASNDTGGFIGFAEADIDVADFAGKNITLVVYTDNSAPSDNSYIVVDNISIVATTPAGSSPVDLYRFWSDQNQGHFFTASGQEKSSVEVNYPDYIWRYEGVAYQVYETQISGTTPVYRFWSDQNQGHFYTASQSERDYVINNYDDSVWRYEGVAYYVYSTQQSGTKPVYRFWSDQNQHHFYTASQSERDYVINNYDDSVWRYEGEAWYVNN